MRQLLAIVLLLAAPLVARADITSNLVGLWQLEETSGTSAADSSGNANNGTYTNSPTLAQSGAFGTSKAVAFAAASSQYVALPNLSASLGDNATLACWIKLNTATPAAASASGICNLGPILAGNASHYPYTDGLAYLSIFRFSNNTTCSRVNSIALPGGVTRTNWHHFCITTTPGTNGWKLYINGSLVTQATGITGVYYDADLWALGRSSDGTSYYIDGKLDDARIYSRALSATDVAELYSFGATRYSRGRIVNVGGTVPSQTKAALVNN